VDSRDHLAAPPAAPLLASVDLSQWMPPITNQGAEGCCTAQTGVRILSWLYRRFLNANLVFSPQFLYRAERLCEGDPQLDGGAQSRTMMACLQEVGVCLETSDPYNDGGWQAPTTHAMLEEANKYRSGAYHRVPDLDTALSVLSSGYPVSLGIDVFQSFESSAVARTGEVPVPDPKKEHSIGGHEVTVYGYSLASKVLLLDNSWGISWGDSGRFQLPFAYWPFVMDCWTAHLGPAWR
jgi:C1A family cysteine protease